MNKDEKAIIRSRYKSYLMAEDMNSASEDAKSLYLGHTSDCATEVHGILLAKEPAYRWLLAVWGIPDDADPGVISPIGHKAILSAGLLLAAIDIEKADTAGKVWAYCGLALPSRGIKYDALKRRAAYTLSKAMAKCCDSPACLHYAGLFQYRLSYECGQGRANSHSAQRAERWITKIILSHLHRVLFLTRAGCEIPAPFHSKAFIGEVDYSRIPCIEILGLEKEVDL